MLPFLNESTLTRKVGAAAIVAAIGTALVAAHISRDLYRLHVVLPLSAFIGFRNGLEIGEIIR
jgi:hypothetical protein